MAERRMFAKSIVLSDAFLDLPMSARCLYFTLGMLADDDGFVNAPRAIMRQCGASDDDIKVLIAKKFVLTFDTGVIVIKHWRINNYLRNDRYTATKYTEEKATLSISGNGSYSKEESDGIPNYGIPSSGIHSIGKDSIGKDSIGEGNTINSISCPVPATQDTGPAFISLPLNDKTEYEVPLSDVTEYKKLYPAVDVEQELRNMRGWCLDSPSKRKTRNGIKRFIGSWLKRQQDRGGGGCKSNGKEDFING